MDMTLSGRDVPQEFKAGGFQKESGKWNVHQAGRGKMSIRLHEDFAKSLVWKAMAEEANRSLSESGLSDYDVFVRPATVDEQARMIEDDEDNTMWASFYPDQKRLELAIGIAFDAPLTAGERKERAGELGLPLSDDQARILYSASQDAQEFDDPASFAKFVVDVLDQNIESAQAPLNPGDN
jgi:hypothetical protein